MAINEQLSSVRDSMRHITSEFPQIMEGDQHTWWRGTARLVTKLKYQLQRCPDEKAREYYSPIISGLFDLLREAGSQTFATPDEYAAYADYLIMRFSMELAQPFEQVDIRVESVFLPLEDMISAHPDRFKTADRTINGEECIVLQVKYPTADIWQEIPLPKNRQVWHKGGPARAVLDIVAGAPISMQEHEFPWNDFDALVGDGRRNKRAAKNIGVDADGIEYMGEKELNFARYCAGRDTTQNQVCLGADGLYYSEDAFTTAVTGHTRIENAYVANKAIYGFDKMTLQGEVLAKPRGLMRLIKAVVEGKAISFDHLPLNAHLDMAVNTLFLSKRWSKKADFAEHLQKLFYLLGQIGQTRPGENDIFAVLERAHLENPFYDFDSEVRYPLEVTRWKARKLVKQIDREMGWKFKIPTNLNIARVAGDNIPQLISLENFVLDPDQLEITEKWQHFLDRSRLRTKAYQARNLTPYEKVFRLEFEDTDGLGVGYDDLIDLT